MPTDQASGLPAGTTIGRYIVMQIEAGADPINAAAVAGVTPAEFMAWMREGNETRARVDAGADWYKDFTPAEQDAAHFADQVGRAHSSHINRLAVILEQAARGGLTKTNRRTKTQNGQVVEIVESVETTLPDVDVARWKLEKLEPTVYGSKATLNVNVQDMTDTEATADLLERRMAEVAKGLGYDDAIETTATEGDE